MRTIVRELKRLVAVALLLSLLGISNADGQYAILIGVDEYASLGEKYRLGGSANDLGLMRKVLEHLGEFEITELSSEAGSTDQKLAPTRANILRELSALKSKVESNQGGNVVFYFSGHGSQQPVSELSAKKEPDNLDEVILPSDTEKVSADSSGGIPNAITDNEIGEWIREVTGHGGELWAIFDCCHSGDMARGSGQIRYRFIPSEDLGIKVKNSAVSFPKPKKESVTTLGNAAILYACKSGEKAIEQPISQMEGRTHGLLTYSLFEVLRKNENSQLSHREMRRKIYESYLGLGRYDGPTPSVEGGKVNSSIFGIELEKKSQLRVSETSPGSGEFLLNAGMADGLSNGAFLAVFESDAPERVKGYIEVSECSPFSSVVKPLVHNGLSALSSDVLGGLAAKVEEVDFDVLKVSVGLDATVEKRTEKAEILKELLNRLSQDSKSGLLLDFNSKPEWLIALDTQSLFIHRNGALKKRGWIKIGEFDDGEPEKMERQIERRVREIAKGKNLLRIINDKRLNPDNSEPSFDLEVQVYDDEMAFRNKEGRRFENDSELRPGNVVQYLVTNTGLETFELTVLEVNSRMEISSHYPTQNRSNEIEPSPDSTALPAILITDNTFGRTHLVFIAVVSNGQTFDLRRLADSNLEAYRNSGPSSPLKKLLESSVFGSGKSRAAPGKLNVHKTLVIPADIVEKE